MAVVGRAVIAVLDDRAARTAIHGVRLALGQRARDKWPIETRHGLGYRLVAPVTWAATGSAAPVGERSAWRFYAGQALIGRSGAEAMREADEVMAGEVERFGT